jgi:Fe-Mn family superoxide dismutase
MGKSSAMKRRHFMLIGAGASESRGAGMPAFGAQKKEANRIKGKKAQQPSAATGTPVVLPDLPYSTSALEPHISKRTVEIHHGTQHRLYVNNLRMVIEKTRYKNYYLEKIMKVARGGTQEQESMYVLSSLIWNHNLYWKSMSPKGGGVPKGKLGRMIQESFKSIDKFNKRFLKLAMRIGVGWVWLMHNNGRLALVRTEYHESPLFDGIGTPLIALDVWEHAYYIDVQSRRDKYVENYLDHLVNWNFAEARLKGN